MVRPGCTLALLALSITCSSVSSILVGCEEMAALAVVRLGCAPLEHLEGAQVDRVGRRVTDQGRAQALERAAPAVLPQRRHHAARHRRERRCAQGGASGCAAHSIQSVFLSQGEAGYGFMRLRCSPPLWLPLCRLAVSGSGCTASHDVHAYLGMTLHSTAWVQPACSTRSLRHDIHASMPAGAAATSQACIRH